MQPHAKGGIKNGQPPTTHLPLPVLLPQTKRTQPKEPSISTEAPHAFVSSTAENAKNHLIPLPLRSPQFIFRIFRPKSACQAPNPPNPLKQNKIELAF
jgi:hypothetical protein